ncbi:nucleotide exchange factor GrpE [Kitasatospora terrestris]|uniref:Protein GrpE n=1 Tax=Kitasatospora terrestris TaxID=258051 RepID=A0ABP9E7Q4_9ACTN
MTDPGGDRIERLLAERTADLQRLQAEFANYRKRVHRDRLVVGEAAVANVLAGLLPVLDALDAARAQGRLTGGLRAVAELLESRLGALGLESVGEPGDPFDPTCHDAVDRAPGDTGTAVPGAGPVCAEIVRTGYRVGGHLLRPAEVVVTQPLSSPPPPGSPPGSPPATPPTGSPSGSPPPATRPPATRPPPDTAPSES